MNWGACSGLPLSAEGGSCHSQLECFVRISRGRRSCMLHGVVHSKARGRRANGLLLEPPQNAASKVPIGSSNAFPNLKRTVTTWGSARSRGPAMTS